MPELYSLIPNFYILITGLASAFSVLLGFYVYFNNPKSHSSLGFLLYAIFSGLWMILTYFVYNSLTPLMFLWFLRFSVFVAIWFAFSFYFLFSAFPQEKTLLSKNILNFTFLISVLVSILTLTNLVFRKVIAFQIGGNLEVENDFGIYIFAVWTTYLNLAGLYFIIKKFLKSPVDIKKSYFIVIIGYIISIVLILICNLILPAFFNNKTLAPFGPAFLLPFLISTSIAILGYKIINVRVITAALFTFILIIINLYEFVSVRTYFDLIIRLIIFIGILAFGVLLIRSVLDEVKRKEELAELNKKLEQLNRIKSEFLSFASHQVRAPMAVVKGYAELIETQIENVPPQAKNFAHKIRESVNRLLELVEEFMDYRRIEEGKMELHFEEVDLVSLIKEFVNNFNLIAKEKNLELTFETSMEQCLVKVDKMRFSQVIQNLIDNAIKYTNQGWVKVSLQKEDNSVLITVADSGIGMSKELQQKLFGEFVRDPSIKKEIRGTGLGLYIAKYIVEARQGKIWAESEGEGKGSKFYVRLPLN